MAPSAASSRTAPPRRRARRLLAGTERLAALPRYPLAVNHAAATAWRGRLIVIGGYVAQGVGTARVVRAGRRPLAGPAPDARVARSRRCRRRRRPPLRGRRRRTGRARRGARSCSRPPHAALEPQIARARATRAPPVTASAAASTRSGAGSPASTRTCGTLQVLDPRTRRLTRLRPSRTHAAAPVSPRSARSFARSAGEEPSGTIASVYAYDTRTRRWRWFRTCRRRATA